MTASFQDVERWKEDAKRQGAKYIISVCDTFDWDDYPVFIKTEEELKEKEEYYRNASMQKINEIIKID